MSLQAARYADPGIFEHAPRYHGGGFAGSGLLPDEVPIIADRGELVVRLVADRDRGDANSSTAPAAGVEITADFEFDVPVRFDTDHMAVTIETFRLHRWQQIPIVELRS